MRNCQKIIGFFILYVIISVGQNKFVQSAYGSSQTSYDFPLIQHLNDLREQAGKTYNSYKTNEQTSCEELINYATKNGSRIGSLSAFSLMNSEWLKSVDAYSIEDVIVVIAEIKKDNSYSTKKYIFCNVPSQNWDNFSSSWSERNKTYGEKFHDYIMNYQCACN